MIHHRTEPTKPLERLLFPVLDGGYWLAGHTNVRLLVTTVVLAVSFGLVPIIGFWSCVITLLYGATLGWTSAVHYIENHLDTLIDPATEEGT